MTSANDSPQDIHAVSHEALRAFAAAVLETVNVRPEDAAFVAQVLTEADLRGVESHGVTRLAGYVSMIKAGVLNARSEIRVAQDSGACAALDGGMTFGMLAARRGMDMAMEKAQEFGVSLVTARNMSHTGMVGFYPMTAAARGMIGIALNNGPSIVPPFGGRTPTYATNPISIAVPAGREEPVVLDMATTMVAAGKLRLAGKKGGAIPLDWGLDRNGQPSGDPQEVLLNGFLQWAGGYKGFGLGTMVEILGGVLSGGLFGSDAPNLKNFGKDPLVSSGAYIAVDISRFMPLKEFGERVDRLVAQVRASERAPGVERIYVPGEPEFLCKKERLAHGIPLSAAVRRELETLAEAQGLLLDLWEGKRAGI